VQSAVRRAFFPISIAERVACATDHGTYASAPNFMEMASAVSNRFDVIHIQNPFAASGIVTLAQYKRSHPR
jgi:hypothetical protein